MSRTILSVLAAGAFLAFPASELSGQIMDMERESHPGMDAVSLHVTGGGFFSTSNLGGGNEFDDTGALGAQATYWAHRNVGVRGNLLWASPDLLVEQESPLLNEDPNVYHYSGDLLLRFPFQMTGQMSWFPYIVGGLGGKTYDFETRSTDTDFAGNFGAGLELRLGELGRWGLNTEVRDFVSDFDRAGFNRTLNDVVWTGGLSINF